MATDVSESDEDTKKEHTLRLKNRGVCPQCGWTFMQGGVLRPFKADTLLELVAVVMRHRLANELECGDEGETLVEVEDQLCRRSHPSVSYPHV